MRSPSLPAFRPRRVLALAGAVSLTGGLPMLPGLAHPGRAAASAAAPAAASGCTGSGTTVTGPNLWDPSTGKPLPDRELRHGGPDQQPGQPDGAGDLGQLHAERQRAVRPEFHPATR